MFIFLCGSKEPIFVKNGASLAPGAPYGCPLRGPCALKRQQTAVFRRPAGNTKSLLALPLFLIKVKVTELKSVVPPPPPPPPLGGWAALVGEGYR